jgi:SAM-dependent methyltransferase
MKSSRTKSKSFANAEYPPAFQFITDHANPAEITHAWDMEWLRYLSSGRDYSFYFLNMNTSNYALNLPPSVINRLNAEQFLAAKLYKDIRAGVCLPGSCFVGKRVLEMGCGPGIFGRIASRFCEHYTGIDTSQFALTIARLCSPAANTTYTHLFDVEHLQSLRGTMDTCFGRHFFIHMNYTKAYQVLSLLKEFLSHGGTISADFHHDRDSLNKERHVLAREPESTYPSALYHYKESDIQHLADEVGLTITMLKHHPGKRVMYASFA